jgi:hypothetical protein
MSQEKLERKLKPEYEMYEQDSWLEEFSKGEKYLILAMALKDFKLKLEKDDIWKAVKLEIWKAALIELQSYKFNRFGKQEDINADKIESFK